MLKLKQFYRLASALALLIALVAGGAAPAQARVRPATPDFATINAYVDAEMRAASVPGLALGIVQGDRVVHLKGFGSAGDDRPVTPQTPFLIGSLSKSFTALAVMQLVEAGKIELDAPAQRYLPWFHVADPAASARITVRHLLTHTSGIPTSAYQPRPDATLEQHVRALADVELTQPVGAAVQYSSPNFQVLGMIVQTVAGQPFETYIQQHIFAPLEMRHSYTSAADALRGGMAAGHQFFFGIPRPTELFYVPGGLPNGFIISSAEDLARYLSMQLSQGRYGSNTVLSPAGIAEMHQPAAPSGSFSYAMGWRVGPTNGIPSIWHGGDIVNFRASMALAPEEGWGVVVLTNITSVLGENSARQIASGVISLLAGREPPAASGLSLTRLYLLIDLGMLAIIAAEIRGFAGLLRWRRQVVSGANPKRRGLVSAVTEIILPILLLFAALRFFDISWAAMVVSMPDMSFFIAIVVLSNIIRGIIKGMIAFNAFRDTRAVIEMDAPQHG